MSTPETVPLPDYAPVPRSALGPALNEQGYYVGRVERNLYWVTDGTYQSAFLTTPDGVVLFDAPPTIGHNIQRAVDEIAAANGVSNKVTHLIYSHHHADHAGASSLFDKNVVRIGHEETRRLLLRDDDPARPAPEETFQDRRTPRDRRRAHRPGLARLQPLARQHLHPPARPRHADARRHRQPGLGAGLHLQPHRGHPRLHRGARPPRSPTRGSTSSAATSAGSAPATTSRCTSSTWPTSPTSSRKALDTVDPTPYFVKYGENAWAAVKGYLDAVTAAAAAPVIEKYTGVLAAADVFTASTDVLGHGVDPPRPRLRLPGAPLMALTPTRVLTERLLGMTAAAVADPTAREFLRHADPVLARVIDERPDFRPRAGSTSFPLSTPSDAHLPGCRPAALRQGDTDDPLATRAALRRTSAVTGRAARGGSPGRCARRVCRLARARRCRRWRNGSSTDA